MNWGEIQRQQRKKEEIIRAVMAGLFLIGIMEEIIVKFNYGIPILNLDGVSLVVIQIQATVFALTIALIALMGGRITDSYLGIRLNDFLLNRKPCIFTQKRIIGFSLVLLMVNVLFHMIGWYNLVVILFIVTCITVWISVNQIYEAFTGKEQIEVEIEGYLKYRIEEGNEEEQIDILNSFCHEWKKIIGIQRKGEYENYLTIFYLMFQRTFSEDEMRIVLQDRCVEFTIILLEDERTAERGIRYLIDLYKQAWKYINDHREETKKFRGEFHVFYNCYKDFCSVIGSLPIEKVENIISWGGFTDTIILINTWLAYSDKDPCELRAADEFGGFIGEYISENVQSWSNTRWGYPLARMKDWISSYPNDDLAGIARAHMADRNLQFAQQLVYNGLFDILKANLYSTGMRQVYNADSEFIKMALKVHCCIYYLAYYETTSCVDQAVMDRCRHFIEDREIKSLFSLFIHQAAQTDKNVFRFSNMRYDIFNKALEREIKESLQRFEFYPKDGSGKALLMDYVVRDFVLFLTAYISNYFNVTGLTDTIIAEEEAVDYFIHYVKDNSSKDKLKRFLGILDVEKSRIDIKANAIDSELERHIRLKYKMSVLHKSERMECITDQNIDTEKENLCKTIKDYLEENYGGLLEDSLPDVSLKMNLLRITAFADMPLEDYVRGNYEILSRNFTIRLYEILNRSGRLEIIRKSDFRDDDEYIQFLKSKNGSVYIGSEFSFRTPQYRHQEAVADILHTNEHYLNGANDIAMILDRESLKLYIRRIRIGVHPETITESEAEYDRERKVYSYPVSSDMTVEFSEEELKKYLENTKRVVDIVAHIDIKIAEGVTGTLII